MQRKYSSILFILCSLAFGFSACEKGWLEEKPDQSLVIPDQIQHLQALLDKTFSFNNNQFSLHEPGTDNYYLTQTAYDGRPEPEKNVYKWASTPDFYAGQPVSDWDDAYFSLFKLNTVLENIDKIDPGVQSYSNWANVRGSALFHRAYINYNLAQLFCKPYSSSASSDLGIVLRLEPDINIKSKRASVEETYQLILNDLKDARLLLPESPMFKTRPSKIAAYAMLARTYLSMSNYDEALRFADSCLNIDKTLLNYRNITNKQFPFPAYNSEVLFHTSARNSLNLPLSSGRGTVDTTLFNSYNNSDLRRTLFFKVTNNRRYFGGSYYGRRELFNGLAIDEVCLVRSECLARKGQLADALAELNALLELRWVDPALFVPYNSTDANTVLNFILNERRKELCFRGIRWTDLRRLNQDPQHAITLKRVIDGQEYNLLPNDNKYVYPIPNSEILYSNIPQNIPQNPR
jgi:starch-binding outer membrane protein, SusD/RagB family